MFDSAVAKIKAFGIWECLLYGLDDASAKASFEPLISASVFEDLTNSLISAVTSAEPEEYIIVLEFIKSILVGKEIPIDFL
jgi:hypothetical protein